MANLYRTDLKSNAKAMVKRAFLGTVRQMTEGAFVNE